MKETKNETKLLSVLLCIMQNGITKLEDGRIVEDGYMIVYAKGLLMCVLSVLYLSDYIDSKKQYEIERSVIYEDIDRLKEEFEILTSNLTIMCEEENK